MANEVLFTYTTARTCYVFILNKIGQVYNTSSTLFETYNTANISLYAISATGQGSASPYYEATFPSIIAAGIYSASARQQLGGSVSENDPVIAGGDIQWNGAAVFPLSDLATSGQVGSISPIRVARSWMIKNFPIYLKSSADHVTPLTSGMVSGQISRDGGAFGVLQSGTWLEIGQGWYSTQALTSGDLAANTVALLFTANGVSGGQSDPLPISLVTQRISGF